MNAETQMRRFNSIIISKCYDTFKIIQQEIFELSRTFEV